MVKGKEVIITHTMLYSAFQMLRWEMTQEKMMKGERKNVKTETIKKGSITSMPARHPKHGNLL